MPTRKQMEAISLILKKRFPNLRVDELIKLSYDLADAYEGAME